MENIDGDFSVTIPAFEYVKSRCNAATHIFMHSDRDEGRPMYSFIWEAIRLYRTNLLAVYEHLRLSRTAPGKVPDQMVLALANSHYSCLRRYILSVELFG